jgi:UDP-N-acetylglucosamine 1-carboxyvinyltransferase
MGADIDLEHGYINARAPTAHRDEIRLRRGDRHGHGEPDDGRDARGRRDGAGERRARAGDRRPAACLVTMGARITGAGSDRITIEGVAKLHGATHAIMPDRIETGTFAAAVAAAGGDVAIVGAAPARSTPSATSCRGRRGGHGRRHDAPRASYGATARGECPHRAVPGFPTDMQAQFMALATVAEGTSVLTETIFENRMMHVQELVRLGASIEVEGNTAIVKGVDKLAGANVMATDLRASACLVIAA